MARPLRHPASTACLIRSETAKSAEGVPWPGEQTNSGLAARDAEDGQGRSPFAFAGLWHPPDGGEPVESRTIITTEVHALIGRFHDRMPVMLDPEHFDLLLQQELPSPLDESDADAVRPYRGQTATCKACCGGG